MTAYGDILATLELIHGIVTDIKEHRDDKKVHEELARITDLIESQTYLLELYEKEILEELVGPELAYKIGAQVNVYAANYGDFEFLPDRKYYENAPKDLNNATSGGQAEEKESLTFQERFDRFLENHPTIRKALEDYATAQYHNYKYQGESLKEGANFVDKYLFQPIGNFFRGEQKEPNPYYQPYFYGQYKDYKELPEMTGAAKHPPGLMGTKMTPEAYADLIVAAVPDAVKRAQEAKAKTPGEKGMKEAEPADTQDVLATLSTMLDKIDGLVATVVAAIPGAAKNGSEQPEKAPTGGPDSSGAPAIGEMAKIKEILMNQLIQNATATAEARNAVATVDERVKNIAALLDEHARKMFRQNYESSWTKPTDMADTRDRHNITIRGLKNYR